MTLWDEIVAALPPAELDEVKRLLGSELIDSNQALQSELQAVTDMCENMRLDTESCNQQHVLMQTTERSLVESDLKFLLSRLCSHKSVSQQTDGDAASTLGSEQNMQNYLQTKPSCGMNCGEHHVSRSSSIFLAQSSLHPFLSGTGVAEDPALTQVRSSFMQTQQAEMQAVKDHFQEALAAEQQELLSDIEHMHACLAEEADIHAHAQLVPPPLSALRAFSVKLQAQLQEEEAQQQHEQKLEQFEHCMSRGPTTPGSNSLAASVSEHETFLAKAASKRPDTAYEGGSLAAGLKTTVSSTNSRTAIDDYFTRPSDTGPGTLQDVNGVTQKSDATLAVEKLDLAGLEPPKKAGGTVKPSPRPRQACKIAKATA